MMARLTVIYLLAVSLAIFLLRDPRFLPALLAVHLIAATFAGVSARDLRRIVWRLRFLFLFLLVVQAIFPPRSHFLVDWIAGAARTAARPDWTVGLAVGAFQIAQIFTMVLVSTLVRRSGDGRRLIDGLRGWFVPQAAVDVIDACFAQLESDQPRRAHRPRADDQPQPMTSPLRSIWRGDVGWIIDRLEGQIGDEWLNPSPDHAARDAKLLTRVTTVLMSLRMLRLAPGTGLTPGYQNVIVVPLLCLAADRTHRRWGATVVGTATGVLSIMLGLGRNGVFIMPAHVLPGFVVDIAWPWVAAPSLRSKGGGLSVPAGRRGPGLLGCVLIGAIAGFTRFTGMLMVLTLLDNAELLAAVPFFSLGHVVFGALSGTVTVALIRESRRRTPSQAPALG